MAKENHNGRHHDCHMTWGQFTNQIKSGDQIWYLKFSKNYCLQLLSDVPDRQKNLINDIVMTVMRSGYNLQTR